MKTDNKASTAGDDERQDGQHGRGHQLVLVQPHQFRIAGKISDFDQVRRIVPAREDPAKMAVEETPMPRRVDVDIRI
jgi:hypothetical protein